MKTSLRIGLLLVTLCMLGVATSHSQKTFETQIKLSGDQKLYPLIFGKKDDGLPEELKVRGEIVESSVDVPYCGQFAFAGTLKIRIKEEVPEYKDEFLYVVVPCPQLYHLENFKDKISKFEVTKLYGKKSESCYLEVVFNKIDSRGKPFYCLQRITSE